MTSPMFDALWTSVEALKGALAELTNKAIDAGTVDKPLMVANAEANRIEHLLFESDYCGRCKSEGKAI